MEKAEKVISRRIEDVGKYESGFSHIERECFADEFQNLEVAWSMRPENG